MIQNLVAFSKQSISLHTENDAYFSPTDFDRYYTAGTNITYTSKAFSDSKLKYIGIFSLLQDSLSSSFSIGISQEIYTPDNKTNIIPPKGDALYGGYLYGNIGIQHHTNNIFESLSIDIGVVGRHSFAKQTQDMVHNILNFRTAGGWDSQIKNEIIVNLYHKLLYRFALLHNIIELLPYSEIALGNAYTHLGVGLNLRLGYGLQHDFGITKVRSSNIGSTSLGNGFRFYIVGGINDRVIGNNIFLQGNTPNGIINPLVLRRFVYEANMGILIGYAGWSISYLYAYRQKEFTTQKAPISYGSIRLEIGF